MFRGDRTGQILGDDHLCLVYGAVAFLVWQPVALPQFQDDVLDTPERTQLRKLTAQLGDVFPRNLDAASLPPRQLAAGRDANAGQPVRFAIADAADLGAPARERWSGGAPMRLDRIADVDHASALTRCSQLDVARREPIVCEHDLRKPLAIECKLPAGQLSTRPERDLGDVVHVSFETHSAHPRMIHTEHAWTFNRLRQHF